MVPILNEVGESMKDKIQVVKIDSEKYPALADKYKIQALPTFILFKDGEVCDRFVSGIDLVFLLVFMLVFWIASYANFFLNDIGSKEKP